MKKLILIFTLIFSLSACSITTMPITHTIELKDMDFSDIEQIKEGKSCSFSILGLFGPFGDTKLIDAVKDAHISKITNYDFKTSNYLLVQRYCTRVYGY